MNTEKEQKVIAYMENPTNKGWFFTDEMRVEGLGQKALGGVLSSLEKKGIVTCTDGMVILTKIYEEA